MSVAVCLSGQTRTIDQCVDSLIKYIVEPLKADVFFHFWSDSYVPFQYYKSWYQMSEVPNWPDFDDSLAIEIINKLRPKKFLIQPQIWFDDTCFSNVCTPENSRMQALNYQHPLCMFYGISRVNHLKSIWERKYNIRYDYVIRARPDLLFHDFIHEDLLKDTSKVYIPKEHGYGGYNDQFAFSCSENMNKYADTYEFIPQYFANGGNFHPETILRRNIDQYNLPVIGIEENYKILR